MYVGHVGCSSKITVFRPISKRKHPLLQEVVSWEKKSLAKGEVVHVSKGQAQVKIDDNI